MKENFKRGLFHKLANKKPIKISRQIPRSWGLAARLEHRRIKGKKSSK